MTASKPGPDCFRLDGRIAVVTGGGGALGSEICAGLARAGASVAVVDLRRDDAERVASSIRSEGGTALAVALDVSDEEAVHRLFEEVDRVFQRVDILVNGISAAIERQQPEDVTLLDWQRMLKINLNSYFLCSRAAGKRMIEAKRGGSIINLSSIAGVTALGRGAMAYGVSKAGVIQLTRETSLAWGKHNIRVNAILPCQFMNQWWTERLADPASQPMVGRVLSGLALGRMGQAREIVGPVLFLASEASSMVTGALLPVDGGNLAMNAGSSLDW